MIRVPFLDLKSQYSSIKGEVNPAIQNVLDNAAFILGEEVTQFETEFALAHDARYCYGVSSGTDGNHLVLWALGVGPGDEVIIPVNTFIATAWGATLCGATPVFVDCDIDSYNIDPSEIEAKITARTKAIVAVHLYGQPADLDPLLEIARKHGLYLVEDCAQAHLAEYKRKKVGSLSDASSFSFYPGKNLGAYGEAGAVATNDSEVAAKFKMFRDHGSDRKYYHETYGHNYRMEAIQAAVLRVKLRHLQGWTEARRRNARRYDEYLRGLPVIVRPAEMNYAKHVYHLYVIRTPHREELQKHLETKGVATGLHYPVPLHLQKAFQDLGYRQGDFPVAEKVSKEILSLPMYPELTEQQIKHVCDSIMEFID
ncbi:MAG: DegT/DnrJ/EryC1/StrS family aminotransferase [Ignavibacteria bacterium]|nr:DegT/DnrJ/EryC1/StrS family aminotransferase [Ignavibacteria bacterium]